MAAQQQLPLEDDEQAIAGYGDEDVSLEIPIRYSITSYGADYPVDGLVRRLRDGSIFIPEFQRGFVWDLKKASRFIESLLLGLPVPGIFLSREENSQKLLVIDGQQRLMTLRYYYDGFFADSDRRFVLRGVQRQYEGQSYETLPEEERRRLDDAIIHATVVRQDEPEDDNSSVYEIFHRLNTGGILLQPQEIRSSINHGPFSQLLRNLNGHHDWRAIYGNVSKKMRDQELILRFLALYLLGNQYRKPMTEFLNVYMARNRNLTLNSEDDITHLFDRTIEVAFRCLGSTAFKPQRVLNAAVFDAVMVGLARRLEKGPITDCDALKKQYEALNLDSDFGLATQKATTDEESVTARLRLATEYFSEIA